MSESRWKIRNATEADSTLILECLRVAFDVYRSAYSPEAFADTVLTPAMLRQRLTSMCLFVAVSDAGEVVGTIGCSVVGASSADLVEGHLRGMAVLPAWQGSGVAVELLRSAETELRTRGCARISLDTTEPLGAAKRFYEKNGFRRSGKIRDFFGMPLFEYVKDLKS